MSKELKPVDVIIPTFNNAEMLANCINSIGATRLMYPMRMLVVNNGHPSSLDQIGHQNFFEIIQTGGVNLGWEGGLKKGLEHSKSDYVMFANDDILIPHAMNAWLRMMLETFADEKVGAVGPTSNFVTGHQNMLYRTPYSQIQTTYLIGFCILLRRKALDEVGGIDWDMKGGDDFDLSIKLRKKGYSLVCRRDVFVYHYGCVTGNAIHGGPSKRGGWNSAEMREAVNMALIKKHGFAEWFQCIAGYDYPPMGKGDDHEGNLVRERIIGDRILDLGCANNKTINTAVGVDIVKKGEPIPFLNAFSEGDVVANVEATLPFDTGSQDTVIARHILEHCIDIVPVIKEWSRVLRHDGRLIIAVPNEEFMKTIPMNGEHVHAFTPNSLRNIVELCGMNYVDTGDSTAGSIVMTFSKNGVMK